MEEPKEPLTSFTGAPTAAEIKVDQENNEGKTRALTPRVWKLVALPLLLEGRNESAVRFKCKLSNNNEKMMVNLCEKKTSPDVH